MVHMGAANDGSPESMEADDGPRFSRRALIGLGAAGGGALLGSQLIAPGHAAAATQRATSAAPVGDGDPGSDLTPTALYGFAGEKPGAGDYYDRLRLLTSKWGHTASISSGGGAGSTSITLSTTPVSLQPNQPMAVSGGASDMETVFTSPTYVAESNPVQLATAIKGSGRNTVFYDRYSPHGPRAAEMTAFGVLPVACAITEGPNGSYTLMLGAGVDQGPPINTLMTSPCLVSGPAQQMDRQRSLSNVGDGLGVALTSAPASHAQTQSATNAVTTITLAATPGQRHRLTMLSVSYSATPSGGNVQVLDGAAPILNLDVAAVGACVVPLPAGGIGGTAGQSMTVTLAAGGSGVVGRVNIAHVTA